MDLGSLPVAGQLTFQFPAEAEGLDHELQVADFGGRGVAEEGVRDPVELIKAETVHHVKELEAEERVVRADALPLAPPNRFNQLHENSETLVVGQCLVQGQGFRQQDEVGKCW